MVAEGWCLAKDAKLYNRLFIRCNRLQSRRSANIKIFQHGLAVIICLTAQTRSKDVEFLRIYCRYTGGPCPQCPSLADATWSRVRVIVSVRYAQGQSGWAPEGARVRWLSVAHIHRLLLLPHRYTCKRTAKNRSRCVTSRP